MEVGTEEPPDDGGVVRGIVGPVRWGDLWRDQRERPGGWTSRVRVTGEGRACARGHRAGTDGCVDGRDSKCTP